MPQRVDGSMRPQRNTNFLSGLLVVICAMLSLPRHASAVITADPATAAEESQAPLEHRRTGSRREAAEPDYAKGQLLIKFKPSLRKCAHCLFEKRQRFATALSDFSDTLDQLNRDAGVSAITPLYPQWHRERVSDASHVFRRAIDAVKRRFPKRTRRALKQAAIPDLTHTYRLTVNEDTNIDALCQRYRANPHVAYCQPNYRVEAQFTPNDPYYSSQGSWGQPYDDLWALKADKLNLAQAWDKTQGEGVVVGVIDTGLDYTHPDIAANVWTNPGEIPDNGLDDDANGFIDDVRGWDFAYHDSDPMDRFGHGTHVAGTIAAVGNNGLGIIGVAPQAKIMPVKGLDDLGSGYISDLAQGIVYAASNGADVLNNSWGCDSYCPSNSEAENAVRTAYGLGAVVVFAAGNSSSDVSHYSPQNMTDPKPVVVAASDQHNAPTSFTNFGVLLDVSAPGGGTDTPPPDYDPFRNILSLKAATCDPDMCPPEGIVGTDYLRQAGTSMAAPHAAGVAALVVASRPSFTNEEVRQVLQLSADDLGSPGFDPYTGAGRLNAAKALAVETVPAINMRITTPASGASFNLRDVSSVTITGTAAGADFKQAALFYGRGSTPTEWIPIGEPISRPVSDGVLGIWTIDALMPDTYVLQLVVTSLSDEEFQVFAYVILYREDLLFKQITSDPAEQSSPAIDGDQIVWEDQRNGLDDIYLYDLATGAERQLTTDPAWQENPTISDQRIAWFDNRDSGFTGKSDIYVYDLQDDRAQRVTSASAPRFAPAIDGDRVVWMDRRNGSDWDIYLYDLAAGAERQLTSGPSDEVSPAISGTRGVYEQFQTYIYLYDFSTDTTRQIAFGPLQRGDPKISGDRIVWADRRNGNWDIYLYDLGTGVEQQITAHPADQYAPVISGNRIVWVDERNGNPDVYVCELPTSPPVLAPIGDQDVKEGVLLQFTIRAIDPDGDTLTFSAANVPPGATFDATTATFSWTPTALQAGVYPSIHFEVSDGELSDTEDITITVQEAIRAVTGTVRQATGAPVAGVTILLKRPGVPKPLATMRTDAQGAYRFVGVPPAVYTLQPRPTRRWTFRPPQRPADLTQGDQQAVDFTARPRR